MNLERLVEKAMIRNIVITPKDLWNFNKSPKLGIITTDMEGFLFGYLAGAKMGNIDYIYQDEELDQLFDKYEGTMPVKCKNLALVVTDEKESVFLAY